MYVAQYTISQPRKPLEKLQLRRYQRISACKHQNITFFPSHQYRIQQCFTRGEFELRFKTLLVFEKRDWRTIRICMVVEENWRWVILLKFTCMRFFQRNCALGCELYFGEMGSGCIYLRMTYVIGIICIQLTPIKEALIPSAFLEGHLTRFRTFIVTESRTFSLRQLLTPTVFWICLERNIFSPDFLGICSEQQRPMTAYEKGQLSRYHKPLPVL